MIDLERRIETGRRRQYDQIKRCLTACDGKPKKEDACDLYRELHGQCYIYTTIQNDMNINRFDPKKKTTYDPKLIEGIIERYGGNYD